jgi:hypothetical protein
VIGVGAAAFGAGAAVGVMGVSMGAATGAGGMGTTVGTATAILAAAWAVFFCREGMLVAMVVKMIQQQNCWSRYIVASGETPEHANMQ